MTAISDLPRPAGPITGMERVPSLQNSGNASLPIFALGGVPRGAVIALARNYLADTASTADSDPGAGNLRWDNATQASADVIFIADDDGDAGDIAAVLATLTSGGFLYLQQEGPAGAGVWQKWQVNEITPATGYTKLGVIFQASQGSFADNAAIQVSVQQPNPAAGVDRNNVNTLATSGAVSIDCDLGDYFVLNLSGNVTGITLLNLPAAGKALSLAVQIKQDTTARTVAWPASFKWAGGVAGSVSTGSGAVDLLAITSFDQGTTWLATLAKAFA